MISEYDARLRRLSHAEAGRIADQLGALLIDASEGATVTFFPGRRPCAPPRASWLPRHDPDRREPGAPRRNRQDAEIAQMMARACRGGIGASLLNATEDPAQAIAKTLLTPGAAKGDDAVRLDARLGWRRRDPPTLLRRPSAQLQPRCSFFETLN